MNINDTIISNNNTVVVGPDLTSADIAAAAALGALTISFINMGLKLWKRFWNWKNPGKKDPLQTVENIVQDVQDVENTIIPPTAQSSSTTIEKNAQS